MTILLLGGGPGSGAAGGGGGGGSGGNPGDPFAIDGTSFINNSGSMTSQAAAALTTTHSNMLICVAVLLNSGPVTSITDNTGVTSSWTLALKTGGTNNIELWYAIASASFSAKTITVNFTSSTFVTINAFGISGANTNFPFDGSGSTTASSTAASITTTNANDMLLAAYRLTSSSGSAGASYTLVGTSNSFELVEQQVVAATGTYSAPISSATIQAGLLVGVKKAT